MTNEPTPTPQPAPSPAQIHVPPGAWTATVKDDEGNVLGTANVTGPTNLTLTLTA